MKQIIECGECSAEDMSKKTILATGTGAFVGALVLVSCAIWGGDISLDPIHNFFK